jgi:hypothetical protein
MLPRSLLDQLTDGPLLKTCDAEWDRMEGTDKVRRCLACQRDVFWISAMTPAEAELRLLNASDAVPCIRYARDAAGSVVHAHQEPPPYQPHRPLRSLVVASALGVALAPELARAAPKVGAAKGDPNQCVVFTQPSAAPAPSAPPFAGAAPARAPRPAPAPPAAAPPSARPPAPAPSQPAPPAAPPPPPIPLAGVPPPPREQAPFGTLILKSKVARKVTIANIALEAPLPSYFLTPGPFVMEVRDPSGKRRKVHFTIRRDATTTVDLDRR